MNVLFSWEFSDGCATPICQSSLANKDGVDLLSCILMNDGGMGYARSVTWLEEGIRRITDVKKGDSPTLDWEREDWGVKIEPTCVTIYSMHDSDYGTSLPIDMFEKVLLCWKSFLLDGPEKNARTSLSV